MNSFRASPRGTLKLNVPVIVAMKILPPIASRFLKAYPGVTLEIAANDTFIDVIGAGFDAGVRYEERIERDMIAVPIGPRVQHYVAAAAPAYLAAHGAPGPPARPGQPCLHPAPVRERRRRRLGIRARRRERADQAAMGPLIASATNSSFVAAIAAGRV